MFLIFIKNIALVFLIANSPYIQSYIAKQAIEYAAYHYDIDMEIEKVYLKFPNTLVFTNVHVLDSTQDTIFSMNELNTKISEIKYFDRQIYVDQIQFVEPYINIVVDTNGVANYYYFVNKFTSEDEDTTPSEGFDVFLNNFEIIDAHIKYTDKRKIANLESFDPNNIDIKKLNLKLSNFSYLADTVEVLLEKFSFYEKSGIEINNFSSNVRYCDTAISLDTFSIKTQHSLLHCSLIQLIGNDEDYLLDPLNASKLELNIDTLIFGVADIAPFMPEYANMEDKLYLSGKFKGKLSNFKFKNFNIAYGEDTRIIANLSIDGFPDYDMAFIFGDISKLTTSSSDIRKMAQLGSPGKYVQLPPSINDLGNISFTGDIAGMLGDLVAYGEFNSSVGSIKTDIAIVTDFITFDIDYNGTVQATKLDLGSLLGDKETFGYISLNSRINGVVDSVGNFKANVDCDVSELGILDYNYTGIKLNGDVSSNYFDGEVFINDPNLEVEFFGKYNYGSKNQELVFSTDIWADLNALNITHDTLPSEIKLVLSSDLHGDLLTAPEGDVYLSHSSFITQGKTIKLEQLSFNSFIDEYKQQYLTLRSDYIDLNFYGSFIFPELAQSLYNLGATYAPSFLGSPKIMEMESDNIVNFDVRLKQMNNFTEVFIPILDIENDIFVEGMFSGKGSLFDAIVSIPVVKYDSIYFWGNEFNIKGYKDSLDLNITMQEISTINFPWFENINLDLDVEKDELSLALNWDNYDELRNYGDIKISTKLISKGKDKLPRIENIIHKSIVIVDNTLWEVNESPISIDGPEISIDHFSLTHEDQTLNVDGEISKDESKLLRFLVNNVNISNINPFIANTGYKFDGVLSGNGRIANIYDTASFKSSLSIKDFKINDEDFGRFDLSAKWEGKTNGFNVDGVNKYMKIRGNYSPKTDSLDVNFTVDNFKLDILAPYLLDYEVTNLDGAMDIVLDINGSIKDPNIDGYIDFEKAEFQYDFLKIKAFTDDRIVINKEAILFDNFKLYDEFNNEGSLNGGVYHKNFNDITFDLLVDATNMKLLNTTAKDNSLYYGTAYGTGTAHFTGNYDNFGIDIVAKSEPNTVFVLPMTESYETDNISYVTFVKPASDTIQLSQLVPLKSEMEYYFKMDIEVTPDAEAQIVFDPKVGDLIRGYCSGNLKMEYTSDEDFYMYGELTVVEGDYLFTLENIINKKFHIKPGGTILWTGDSYEAILDLDAVYTARAPLKDLMASLADSSDIYNKAMNVECHMHMSGSLMAPDIQFSILVPNANDKAKAQLANLTQDEINKQLLYLLILNRFYNPNQTSGMTNEVGSTTNAFGVTSSELLSNQLSNWLSQISKDFDIGFNYRPGSEVSGQELEVALSTQILNDRVLINGNVGIGEDKSNTSNLVGDIEVQLKVNKSGSFRVKGFTRANDDLEAEFGPYTNGVGIFYTEDFNTFGELMRKFWNGITFKNARDKRKIKKEMKDGMKE